MHSVLGTIRQFLSELRRRNVYQVAVTYVIVGVFVIEAADLTLTRLGLPGWTVTLVIVLVGLGFPIALVLAWALEVTPEGVRVEEAEGSEEVPASSGSPRDLWVGASVLALLLVGAWWMWSGVGEGGGANQAKSRTPETRDRSIAVLPFEVSGAGAEAWRDGMVTMLSMNLDGAAGLRAIADRRIFAAAQQVDSMGIGPGQNPSLTVAKRAGAKYAVVGSAVQLGEELRLGAEIREVASGELLGQTEVEGPPGSITALTDRLTRKVLGVLLDRSEDRIPSVSLESITTGSLKALRSYLAGERHFRSGEYEAALAGFERAIQQDSTFALAYARSAFSRDMAVGAFGAGARYWQRAYEWADQLPSRERGIVQAWHLRYNQYRGVAAADTLRELGEQYPDDPSIWYILGEVLWHTPVPRGLPEADRAFQRAIDLDPGVAIYHLHPMGLALNLHRDSALAAQRIAKAPDTPEKRLFRLGKELVFGGADRRQEALARLDTASFRAEALPLWPVSTSLLHPTDGVLQEKALRRIGKRGDIEGNPYAVIRVANSFERGQSEKALAQIENLNLTPSSSAPATLSPSLRCLVAGEVSLGTPVPDSTLRAYLAPFEAGKSPSISRLRCGGIYLVETGRGDELPALIQRIRKAGGRQDVPAAQIQAAVDELKGYRALKAGDFGRAERLLGGHNESWFWGAIWRGDLYRKLGELKKAEGWYLAAWWHPLTHERLGRLYEEMGRPQEAAEAYERFIEAWKNADPELRDRVEKVQRRIEALRETEAAEYHVDGLRSIYPQTGGHTCSNGESRKVQPYLSDTR